MNDTTDPWESAMSRTFDARVRDLHEAPLTFEQVKGRAGRIRRNRRLAAAGGLVAAAAVIVPVGVLGGQGLLSTDPGPGPGPADGPSQLTDPDGGFAHAEGRTLHLSDGSTAELSERYDRISTLGDQLLAVRPGAGGERYLDVLDADGGVLDTVEVVAGVVTNDDHTTAAYLDISGRLVTMWPGGSSTIADGFDQNTFPVAVTGACSDSSQGCRVVVEHGDASAAPEAVAPQDRPRELVPGVVSVNDAHDSGKVAVQISSTMSGSCGGVYDEVTRDYAFDTCDYQVLDLSPSGGLVTGTDAYGDGAGLPYVTVLDSATGEELARFEPEGFVGQIVWEDDEHLLVTTFDQSGWSIHRFGIDGSTEQLHGPTRAGGELEPGFVLVEGS